VSRAIDIANRIIAESKGHKAAQWERIKVVEPPLAQLLRALRAKGLEPSLRMLEIKGEVLIKPRPDEPIPLSKPKGVKWWKRRR